MTQPLSLILMVLLFRFAAVSQADDAAKKYVDDKYNFSLTVSEPWADAKLQDYTVPGVARTAYSGKGGASIVAFIQEPGKAFEPRFLVDESAKSIEKNLGATVRQKEVRTVAGKKAMWLVIEGKGTGSAIDGKGAVATTQHWVAIPREKDIVVVLLTSPATDYEANEKSFEKVVKSMTVGGTQTEAQGNSK